MSSESGGTEPFELWPVSTSTRTGDYYATYMDEARIESLGLKPIQGLLDRINGIGDRPALTNWIYSTLRTDVDALNATNFYTDRLYAWRAELFNYQYERSKLGKAVDRSEWAMTPQTVNALNLPVQNALNFPAAILRPPFYDPKASAAVIYGSIGAVIGHEISHSFDDQGAQFDSAGKFRNWWTPEDFAHFKEAGARLVAQFNAYQPFPDLHVNGQLTLSENIADVAGLSAAYDAYRAASGARQSTAAAPAGQFTEDQKFFISYGQSWRTRMREPLLRQVIVTDGHAPDEYRADTVRNLDAWYAAFEVKSGQKLYLEQNERVRVW